MRGEDLKESSDEDIAARAEAEIKTELPTLFAPLPQLPTLSAPFPLIMIMSAATSTATIFKCITNPYLPPFPLQILSVFLICHIKECKYIFH